MEPENKLDIAALAEQAAKELLEEQSKAALTKIKAKQRQIAAAEQVVTNLKAEYDALLILLSEGNI